ncbi:hypothetical protein LA080_016216 [Diaporthe eres]|nr:hypothetical protein LA080_016216 [Diaporthe eres]
MPFTGSDICKILLAIFLPPLGVFFERGCGADLLINILLTILGYIPGIIHALELTTRHRHVPHEQQLASGRKQGWRAHQPFLITHYPTPPPPSPNPTTHLIHGLLRL